MRKLIAVLCFQSAHRPLFSTEPDVLKVCSDIIDATDRGFVTLLCLFNLSAAFNTVDHNILLWSLHHRAGFCSLVLRWFTSYLEGRSLQAAWGSSLSAWCNLSCGVPQGFVLAPLLFLIYTSNVTSLFLDTGSWCTHLQMM